MTADMPLSDHDLINLSGYSFSISARRSSFDFPRRCCRRPRSSSSFPSAKERSSSVNWPYFCFNFPFTSFQLPLTCNFVLITMGLRRSLGVWLQGHSQKAPRTRAIQSGSFGLPATRRQSAFTEPSQVSPHYQFQSKRGNRFLANVRDCFLHGIGRENQIEIGSVDHPLACHFLKHL